MGSKFFNLKFLERFTLQLLDVMQSDHSDVMIYTVRGQGNADMGIHTDFPSCFENTEDHNVH